MAESNGGNGDAAINRHASSAICSIDDFIKTSFDYLILGGRFKALLAAQSLDVSPITQMSRLV